ncbi:MAG: acyl-CoA dehydratase activase-related protein [Bacillota bacterium]|nr:CoA protein activase [Bacillota bacterium]HOB91437.1 acyl-CoA dehydratase activase-related protein [Bacillota bacterium]HPZ54846.1 acyl-CoA dehydratase activase-related protein [Bacillota bacterium]HQD17703.1 acyl-CoA dehydratase activase-related protein [Bacillota bacterium]
MRITFPYMGYYSPVFSNLFRKLGHDVVPPPKPSKRTLDLGTKYAPEFACLPLKILLGTYIETLEMGADAIVSSGGVGPCRAGYYTRLQEKILRSLGYDFTMYTVEPPKGHMMQLLKTLRAFVRVPVTKLFDAIVTTCLKLWYIDEIERLCHKIRPLEVKKGTSTRLMEQAVAEIDKAESYGDVRDVGRAFIKKFNEVEVEDRDPLKVGIIGEIYVVLEPSANFEVIENLNKMGVYAHRSIFLTDWVKENAFLDALRIQPEKEIRSQAKPYLNHAVGGHGENTIGETVRYAKSGYDGVIQLVPFTCIPEIVARSILPRVSRDLGIPVMSLILDEQTGLAGVLTRLEAFVDLLARRRMQSGELPA